MKLPPAWREFIGSLCSHRARFLVVGAHALAAHGRPRATQDIDILVEPTRANARRVCAALADFGFTALAEEVDAFATLDWPVRSVLVSRCNGTGRPSRLNV